MTHNPTTDFWAALVAARLLTGPEATRYRTGLHKPSRPLLRAWAAMGYTLEGWPGKAS